MDQRTVSVITGLVLVPMVAVSAYAYITGQLSFAEYVAMWKEPALLMIGYWFRNPK